MKVTYRLACGYESTAYLDDDAQADGGIYSGQDKYTDADVRVRWDDEAQCWQEVPV